MTGSGYLLTIEASATVRYFESALMQKWIRIIRPDRFSA